jgi:general secretion pathway protein E
VRKLCSQCKRQDGEGRWHPVGCDHCGHTGYKGRTGVYELMVVDDKLRDLIHNRAAESALFAAARANGFVAMREDGDRLVAEGITSPEEVLRVTRD